MSRNENALTVRSCEGAKCLVIGKDGANVSTLAPLPDKSLAEKFLNWLDPDAERFEFRYWPENPKGRPVKLSGALSAYWERLQKCNQKGSGVFVQVAQNAAPLEQADKDIARIRALFADFDKEDAGIPSKLLASELPPSIIIESSPNRWHAYWLLADSLPLDAFKPLQQAIAHNLGSDPAICDLARIMRLPGFLHNKGEPFLTRIVHPLQGDPIRYEAAQIKAHFPPAPSKPVRPRGRPPKDTAPAMTLLERACEAVANAPENSRNHTLNRNAFHIAQRLASGWLEESEEQARAALADAARAAGLDEIEIAATLDSAFIAGMAAPVNRYPLAGGHIEYSPASVWHITPPKRANDEPAPRLLAEQLEVAADTWDDNNEAGRLLRGKDRRGRPIELFLSNRTIAGSDIALAQELAARGFISQQTRKERELLASHLRFCPVEDELRLTSRLGWHGDTYLLPDKAIAPVGSAAPQLAYHSSSQISPDRATKGSLDDWRQQVAQPAQGNSRLMLALCTAFAAPLLKPYGMELGGFAVHLRGGSSSGKTTALKVAASVYGAPSSFCKQWRSTDNAIEGLAETRNDCLLAIDELGQAEPKALSQMAYMFASGRGKERANKNADNRRAREWRSIMLSTGERSQSEILESAGYKVNAGQEVRFADIETDAGAGMGLLERLNGFNSPAALMGHLNREVNNLYGTAGEAFIQHVVNEPAGQIEADIHTFKEAFAANVLAADCSSQATRVASFFALLAFAGERATRYGITGWQEGEAIDAVGKCFAVWLENYGAGDLETKQALDAVRSIIYTHGLSRFASFEETQSKPVSDAIGYYRYQYTRDHNGEILVDRQYLIDAREFKRIMCRGHNPKTVTKALKEAGWIRTDSQGKTSVAVSHKGVKSRVYVLSSLAMGLHVQDPMMNRLSPEALAQVDLPPVAVEAVDAEAAHAGRGVESVKTVSPARQPVQPNKAASHIALSAQQPLSAAIRAAIKPPQTLHSSSGQKEPAPLAAPPRALEFELKEQERQRQIMADAIRAEAAHGWSDG